jgi:undecaprenyl-diphosphatase
MLSRADDLRFAAGIVLATIPVLVAGALLAGVIKRVLYQSPTVFAVSFIVGGVVMLAVERLRPTPRVVNAENTTLPRAFGIGVCQALALIPGVSRSGATIVGGMVLGLDRAAAAEFSFFLAIPTMTAAFAHELLDIRHQLSAARTLEIAVGLVMAFISSLLIIKPFLTFVRRSGFAPFAWYRVALGTTLLLMIAAGWLNG